MNHVRYHTLTILAVIASITLSGICYGQSSEEEDRAARKRSEAKLNAKQISEARQKRRQILSAKRKDMRDPKRRAQLVQLVKKAEDDHRKAVRTRAKMKGVATEGVREDGVEFVLVDFDENDLPIYLQTENSNAAISTATDLVRSNASYNSVEGSSVTIGLWEASGVPRVSHQELVGRVTVEDGTTTLSSHAVHVAGTLAASGVQANAKGMAPAAKIAAFTSSGYQSELLSFGADAPNTTKLYLSNHSYGTGQGWEGTTWRGAFVDDGNPATNFERDFGRYSFTSELWDDISYTLPYHLMFISAGNQRDDDAPDNGDSWTYGSTTYTYDSSVHPHGDGDYKDGWDNMEGRKLSKNSITVGNTADAVTGGVRDAAKAVTRRSSSRGPADDGRIKPDIVANGDSLYSADSDNDTDYTNKSGTSMACPNACGSAALLIDYYTSRFPGEAMRASTLKALILHTADDDGNPGPDYRYGWGLMNTKAAADVIKNYADDAGGGYILESEVNDSSSTSQTHAFAWNGTSPLRVTLCWTDPPGIEKSGHDERAKALVNDLNLRVTGPGGTHYPFVMPHVGNWSVNSIDDDAVTGINDVDPVEQVYLASPAAGNYVITVDYAGALTDNLQEYSLIVTGQTAPEIEIEEDGPPVVVLLDNSGVQSFGVASPSDPSVVRSYTVRNSGGSPLNGLSIGKSGAHQDDFIVSALSATKLEAGESASFSVSYDPVGLGLRSCSLQLTSNDADENPFDIDMIGLGFTELEGWRVEHFGSASNSGDAANDFDYDDDGLVNLLEFGLGTLPKVSDENPISFAVDGTVAELDYPRSIIAMSEFDFEVVWTDDLSTGNWFTLGVSEQVLGDDGMVQQVQATKDLDDPMSPGASGHRFFRLRMSEE